ncbi:MAG: DUF4293 domain-containing protein [Bacteroidota bacterium]
MLQRIQTIYLLIAFILSILLFTGPVSRFSTASGEVTVRHSGAFSDSGDRLDMASWPMTTMFAIVSLLSLYTFLSYKNRIRQMRLAIYLMIVDAGMVGVMVYFSRFAFRHFGGINNVFQWRIILPLVMLVLFYMAFKAVQKDELLVRSYERLR